MWQFSGLNPEKSGDILRAVAIQETLRRLISARLTVKSTSNITRAGRFIEAGRDGMKTACRLQLPPCAHRALGRQQQDELPEPAPWRRAAPSHPGCQRGTHSLSATLARSRPASTAGYGARKTSWRTSANLTPTAPKSRTFRRTSVARCSSERDAYCKFGDAVYGRVIWKSDELERFISKTAVLGLGFKMGRRSSR